MLKSIQDKSITKNIIFTKEDKGNTVVAIKKNEYIQKNFRIVKPQQI